MVLCQSLFSYAPFRQACESQTEAPFVHSPAAFIPQGDF